MTKLQLMSPVLIDQMIKNAAFHQFEFLKSPPREPGPRVKTCGGCGGRRNRAVRPLHYNAIKQSIVELSGEQRDILKGLLGCTNLKVQYRAPNGALKVVVI